jgi:hypothetical protein
MLKTPEKKLATVDNMPEFYQKVTTISIVNSSVGGSGGSGSTEDKNFSKFDTVGTQPRVFQIKHQPPTAIVATSMNEEKTASDLPSLSHNESSTTEYEIRILTTEQHHDELANYDEYSYEEEVGCPHLIDEPDSLGDAVDKNASHIHKGNSNEEDRFTQILTYENSIIEKSEDDDSRGLAEESCMSEETAKNNEATDVDDDDEMCGGGESSGKKSATIGGVPQTLISCLNELQCGGNLVSWKITGVGENLSVKITWSNEQRMNSSKHVLEKPFLADNLLEGNRLWQIGNSSDYEELNEVLFKNDAFKVVQSDLGEFRSKFKNCIKCLLNGLTLKEQRKKANACIRNWLLYA